MLCIMKTLVGQFTVSSLHTVSLSFTKVFCNYRSCKCKGKLLDGVVRVIADRALNFTHHTLTTLESIQPLLCKDYSFKCIY